MHRAKSKNIIYGCGIFMFTKKMHVCMKLFVYKSRIDLYTTILVQASKKDGWNNIYKITPMS
jgi:hypothetical protein